MHEMGVTTPLRLALLSWSPETIRALDRARDESKTPYIEHLSGEYRIGMTPRDLNWARDIPHEFLRFNPTRVETVQVLIRHGADMDASDETHLTPLHLASCRDCKAPDPTWSRFNAKDGRQSTPGSIFSFGLER
jgi:hypothetical protein